MEKNQNYWDKKNIKIDSIKLTYYDGSNTDTLYKGFDEGTYLATPIFQQNQFSRKLRKNTVTILLMEFKMLRLIMVPLILIVQLMNLQVKAQIQIRKNLTLKLQY